MRLPSVILLCAAALCSGCGAGVVTAVFAGSRSTGGTTPESSITLSDPEGPLSIEPLEFYLRRAVVRGARLPVDAAVEVRLATNVGGAVVESTQTLLLVERSGDETTLSFALRTDEIAAAVGDVTARDVAAEIVVLAARDDGGLDVLFRTPFLLLRKPTLTLVPDDPVRGISTVSVTGGEIELSVSALPTTDPPDLYVEIVTDDPNPPPGQDPTVPAVLLRRASNVRTEPDAQDPALTIVRATLPSSTFPTQAFARVVHVRAGRSQPVAGIFYRPELTAVVPRRGSTDGGDLVTLSGQGLVPLDFTSRPAQPNFADVRLFVQVGGRELEIPSADLRPSQSSLNTLVFVTPASPSGRPGPAQLRLRVALAQPIDVSADGLFRYGAPEPDFGPRGVAPSGGGLAAAAFGARAVTPDPSVPVDAAVLSADASGASIVRLFESRGNGMFSRVGVPIEAGVRGDPNQRGAVDVLWGEFHGDAFRDVLVVQSGATRSAHTILQGVADPANPLRFAGTAFRTTPSPARGHAGLLDDDTRDDVLVVGSTNAHLTTEYAIPSGTGTFTSRAVFTSPVPLVEASALADVDGDGRVDMLFANGGAAASLRLAFGEPGPLFQDRRTVDLSGVAELGAGEVVGVHAVGPAPDRVVALVVRASGFANPSLVLLPPTAPRTYGATRTTVDLGAVGGAPVRSLVADLDADGLDELVLAREPGGLSVWVWQGPTFVELPGAVGMDPADVGVLRDLAAGPAVSGAAGGPRLGVFVAHDEPTGTPGSGSRITTLLVEPGPRLANARAELALPVLPRGVALAALFDPLPGAAAADVAIASVGRIDLLANDGVGGLGITGDVPLSGLVPESLHALRVGAGDERPELVFLLDDGRVGVLSTAGSAPALSVERLFDGAGTVLPDSRIAVGDVDADGYEDVAVLLAVERPAPAPVERSLVLLRGRNPNVDPLPLIVPVAAARTPLSTLATDVALGDLASDATGRLEAVVAVPAADAERGFHFFRLEPGSGAADAALVPSIVEPDDPRVGAGVDPRLVATADLEGDGRAAIVVVSGTREFVQVFRQTGASTRVEGTGEVDPLVFAPTTYRALSSGTPVALHLVDVDGDGIDDVVVQTSLRSPAAGQALDVALSNGAAAFSGGFVVAPTHVGAGGAGLATTVGDLNGDGLPDLALAWSGDGGLLQPHVRVLFGSYR